MKAVILAGGLGTRLSEETDIRPKPMVEIGGKPMLWHIMNWYAKFGIREFIICGGYKVQYINDYLQDYWKKHSDIQYDLQSGRKRILSMHGENWKVTCLDTGPTTMTGGRIRQCEKYIGDSPFLLTYGDGVGNINILETICLHSNMKNMVTITAYRSNARFGVLDINDSGVVTSFAEKPQDSQPWINAGYFVCNPEIFDYLPDDNTVFEHEPLTRAAKEGKLGAYLHTGFWKPMDTLRDKIELEEMYQEKGNIYGC